MVEQDWKVHQALPGFCKPTKRSSSREKNKKALDLSRSLPRVIWNGFVASNPAFGHFSTFFAKRKKKENTFKEENFQGLVEGILFQGSSYNKLWQELATFFIFHTSFFWSLGFALQIMGDWKSNVFLRYLRTLALAVIQATTGMTRVAGPLQLIVFCLSKIRFS